MEEVNYEKIEEKRNETSTNDIIKNINITATVAIFIALFLGYFWCSSLPPLPNGEERISYLWYSLAGVFVIILISLSKSKGENIFPPDRVCREVLYKMLVYYQSNLNKAFAVPKGDIEIGYANADNEKPEEMNVKIFDVRITTMHNETRYYYATINRYLDMVGWTEGKYDGARPVMKKNE